MHQNRASPFASDFYRRRGYRREFRNEDHFSHFLRTRNRGSLAIFFAEEIAHLGASKNRAIFGGAVKIAAAAAENRAILVHSVWGSVGLLPGHNSLETIFRGPLGAVSEVVILGNFWESLKESVTDWGNFWRGEGGLKTVFLASRRPGKGGAKSPKIRGGVKISNFQGSFADLC